MTINTNDLLNSILDSLSRIDHAKLEALPDISYPMVHYKDNDFYLHRTFEKQDNFAGTIFTDCQNKRNLGDSNTII